MGCVILIICFLLWGNILYLYWCRGGKHNYDIALVKTALQMSVIRNCNKPHELVVPVIIYPCKTNWAVTHEHPDGPFRRI